MGPEHIFLIVSAREDPLTLSLSKGERVRLEHGSRRPASFDGLRTSGNSRESLSTSGSPPALVLTSNP